MSKTKHELLGKGTYGCVFKPEFPCYKNIGSHIKSESRRSLVGKVFKSESAYLQELKLMEEVNKIDKDGMFTMPLIKSCEILLNKKDKQSIKSCKHINYEQIENQYQLIYEYGCITLHDFILKNYKQYDILDYLKSFEILIMGLINMQKKKLCHRDIKETNILIKDKKMYFIDFGLAEYNKDVYDEKYTYVLRHTYVYYPPEFRLYYNCVKKDKELPKDPMINYEDDMNLFNLIGYTSVEMEKDIKSFQTLLLSKKSDTQKKRYLSKNGSKIDVFSLGIVMLCFYEGQHNDKKYPSVFDKLRYEIYNLIKEMIHFNIKERIDIYDLFEKISKINNVFECLKTKRYKYKKSSSSKHSDEAKSSPFM